MTDYITCALCKTCKAKNLMPHLRTKHPDFDSRIYRGLYGSMIPDEVKNKMSKSHIGLPRSEEHCRNLAKSLTGNKLSKSHLESLRVSHLGNKAPAATRDKMSKARMAYLKNGGRSFGYVTGHLETRFGRIFYRSKLEREFLLKAEADSSILSLNFEPFSLKYEDEEGNNRRYLPDCLLESSNEGKFLVEVKPAKLIRYNILKAEAATAWVGQNEATFIFITEIEIYGPSSTTFPWVTEGATADTLATDRVAGKDIVRAAW